MESSFIIFPFFLFIEYIFNYIYCSDAEKYLEEKNYLKAIKKYTEAIDLNKKNSFFFVKRSECYGKLSMWVKSLEDAKKCLILNENCIEAYEQAAIALKNVNKIDEAIEILKRGISVNENPNPFENEKNLKMFTLLEEFEK